MSEKIVYFRVKPMVITDEFNKWFQPGRVYCGAVTSTEKSYITAPEHGSYSIPIEKTEKLQSQMPPALELHQSDVHDLWACPRLFYYKKIMGLSLKKRPSYFTVGEIFHFGVAMMRHPQNVIHHASDYRWTAMQNEIAGYYANHQEELEEAMSYLKTWYAHETKDPLAVNYPVVQVELPLIHRSATWPEGYYIGGTMDALLLDQFDRKKLWIGEEKTAQRTGIAYFRSLKNGPQTSWYYMLLLYNLANLGLENTKSIRGHIFEIVNKSASGSIQRETALLSDDAFQNGVEFIDDSIWRAFNLLSTQSFPRVISSCYGKFNTECPYMPWCYRPGQHDAQYPDLLASMYTIKDPIEALKERQRPISDYILAV